MAKEDGCVFGLASQEDSSPIAVIGVTNKAWEYMKDGKTHTFDLRELGFPVQIMLFGGGTQEEAMALLTQGARENGVPVKDFTDKEFPITPPGES